MSFSTIELIEAFQQLPRAQTFLRDTFFPKTKTFVTEKVEVQYKKGNRKLAPFVAPRLPGKVGKIEGYRVDEYKPAMLKPAREIEAGDLTKASFGENVYSNRSPVDRYEELLGENFAKMEDEIARRLEWMAARILFDGKLPMIGDGVDDEFDFGLTNRVVLTGTASWSNYSTGENGQFESNPLKDVRKWKLQALKGGGGLPNAVIMAHDVAEVFLEHPAVKEELKMPRAEYLSIKPQFLQSGGLMHLGATSDGTEYYTYNEWYYDEETDENVPIVPDGRLVLASTAAQGVASFGAISLFDTDGQAQLFEAQYVPRIYGDSKTSIVHQELQSRPLLIPDNVDSYVVADVLGGE